jgi:hypothetical protein
MQDNSERHSGKEPSTGTVTVLIRHHAIMTWWNRGIAPHTLLNLTLDGNEWWEGNVLICVI